MTRRVALVGAPNCGKTALFNRLTGSRQKVANYPGVTVERKEGAFVGARRNLLYRVTDLPGAYSLVPTTLDEAITRDVVTGRLRGETPPEMIICVLDATNLRLSLRLALELTRLSIPMIVALNMSDLAQRRGFTARLRRVGARARRSRGRHGRGAPGRGGGAAGCARCAAEPRRPARAFSVPADSNAAARGDPARTCAAS